MRNVIGDLTVTHLRNLHAALTEALNEQELIESEPVWEVNFSRPTNFFEVTPSSPNGRNWKMWRSFEERRAAKSSK